MEWKKIGEKGNFPPQSEAVLGFSPDWIDLENNPNGVRECYYVGIYEPVFGSTTHIIGFTIIGINWFSAKWCPRSNKWHVEETHPTHWMPTPKPPKLD